MARTTRLLTLSALVIALVAVPAAAATEIPVVVGGDVGQPAAGSGGIAWTLFPKTGGYVAWALTSGGIVQVNQGRTWGAQGGIDGDTLIYQRVSRKGSDLALYNLATNSQLGSPSYVNSRYWEWRPSISGNWVLFARNNWGMAKREWQRLFLVNIVTGETRMLSKVNASRYQEPGQVNGNWVVWSECSTESCDVYRYDIGASTTTMIPSASRDQYAPAVAADGTMYYSRAGRRCGSNVQIIRRAPDGTESVIHQFPAGTDAWGLSEYTDGTPQQDLYYTRFNCSKGKGAIYRIDGADTAPGIVAPIVHGPADIGPTEHALAPPTASATR